MADQRSLIFLYKLSKFYRKFKLQLGLDFRKSLRRKSMPENRPQSASTTSKPASIVTLCEMLTSNRLSTAVKVRRFSFSTSDEATFRTENRPLSNMKKYVVGVSLMVTRVDDPETDSVVSIPSVISKRFDITRAEGIGIDYHHRALRKHHNKGSTVYLSVLWLCFCLLFSGFRFC
jgi:hypothetical protein